jgi:hypothetical protein
MEVSKILHYLFVQNGKSHFRASPTIYGAVHIIQ